MKRIFPVIAALFLLLLTADPIAGYAKQDSNHIEIPPNDSASEQPVAGDEEPNKHPVRDTSLGCATGAVLGSVLPGLGNAVGCVIGGFVGWWMS